MNILYCGDLNIEEGMILSIVSVVKNIREALHIYVFTMELSDVMEGKCYMPVSESCIEVLDRYVKKKHPASFVKSYDLTTEFRNELPVENMKTRFTPYCMLRLFADKVDEIPDRILYLDNDVLCRKDFTEFYHQNLAGWEFAGVLDYYGSWFFRQKIHKRDYVNSGVLLFNMDLIRRTKLMQKCRARCMTRRMFMPDQTALNKLATTKKLVERCYNDQRHLHTDTVFQHFTTSFRLLPWLHTITVKPWQTERMHSKLKLHEYDDLLWDYEDIKTQIAQELKIIG